MTHPTDALRLVPEKDVARAKEWLNGFGGEKSDVLGAYIRQLEAAAPASPLPEGGGWQDISTAPKDGTEFLAFGYWRPTWTVPDPSFAVMSRRDDSTYCAEITGDATHWMPLPAAPTGAK